MTTRITAEVRSRTEFSDGNGKTQRVHGDMHVAVGKDFGGNPVSLIITAFEEDDPHGVRDQNIQRDLHLELPPYALVEIVNAALKNGLVRLDAVAVTG